jgi:acetyl esterase/lipase
MNDGGSLSWSIECAAIGAAVDALAGDAASAGTAAANALTDVSQSTAHLSRTWAPLTAPSSRALAGSQIRVPRAYARAVAAVDLEALLSELAQIAQASDRFPQRHRYGDGPQHEADLLTPEGGGPHPVAVLLHGGFWRAPFDRSVMAALAVDLAHRGWATWNVEYRRGGSGGGALETLADVRAAVGCLTDLDDAELDLERVVAIGHSAGGQLALCAAVMAQVRAVISMAGVCDLVSGARERIGEGAVAEFMGGSPEDLPGAYALANPIGLVPADANVLLVHGDMDDRVPISQSRDYARAAAAAGAGERCALLELPGVDHFALIDPRSRAWTSVVARLDALTVPNVS